MARTLNIITQIIYLAKKAKIQLEKGKVSSTKRLFKKIIKFEENELITIKEESGSKELFNTCGIIIKETKKASKDFDVKKASKLLDKVIALEGFELKNVAKRGEGLSREILKSLDPYIEDLVNEINQLSFIKQTRFSCSGHLPGFSCPYLIIEYDRESQSRNNIDPFHKGMVKIVKEAGIIKHYQKKVGNYLEKIHGSLNGINEINYYLGDTGLGSLISEEKIRKRLIKQWNLISRLVKKFQDYDSLKYKKQKTYIKKDPKLLGKSKSFKDKLIKLLKSLFN